MVTVTQFNEGMYTPLESFVNMGKKDYKHLTESQKQRDLSFLQDVTERYLNPLLVELNEAIPSYSELSEWERFMALMRINQEYFENGNALCLDFGYCEERQIQMRGWVFPHTNLLTPIDYGDGVTVFDPWFQESQVGTIERMVFSGNVQVVLERRPDMYNALPLPYKIAVMALHIRQNVITTRIASCRCAACWDNSLTVYRQLATQIIGANQQRFGWSVFIRDTMPENNMGIDIAKTLKALAEADISLNDAYIETKSGDVPTYAEHEPDKKQRRANRQTTNNLKDFFTRYLPSQNLYVGRSGEGTRISQSEAFELFDAMYPNQYCDYDSFFKSYYTQRKKWEGR